MNCDKRVTFSLELLLQKNIVHILALFTFVPFSALKDSAVDSNAFRLSKSAMENTTVLMVQMSITIVVSITELSNMFSLSIF